MRIDRRWQVVLSLLIAAAFAVPAGPAAARAPHDGSEPQQSPSQAPKPAPPAVAVAGGAQPKLLGQFGDWGAYAAAPGGKKGLLCAGQAYRRGTTPPGRPRNPAYMFISTRPADKVANEVSIIIGYPFKPGTEATAEVGSTTFALYTQQDGAWIKNAAEEAHMVDAMRQGQTAVVKGTSTKGTQSTDTYSLKGLAQALDRAGQDCK